jgi:ribosome assembly protein YihI (activator of Der GTPase)
MQPRRDRSVLTRDSWVGETWADSRKMKRQGLVKAARLREFTATEIPARARACEDPRLGEKGSFV